MSVSADYFAFLDRELFDRPINVQEELQCLYVCVSVFLLCVSVYVCFGMFGYVCVSVSVCL